MKKITFLLALAFLTLSAANVWADTYSYTFVKNALTTSGGDVTLGDVTWTSSSVGYIGWDNTKGLQIGSSAKPAKDFTLSANIPGEIQSIKINASTANSATATLKVTVGTTEYINTALTKTATDYEGTGTSSGIVSINLTQTTSKGLYMKSIEIVYNPEAGGPSKEVVKLSWGVASYDATIGFDNTLPTLTTTPEDLTGVKFTTSKAEVATVNETTGEVTLVGNGVAEIIASFAETDTHYAAEAKYTLNVASKTDDEWTLVTDASTLVVGDELLIAAAESDFAMSTTQNSNNRGVAPVMKDGSTLAANTNAQVFTLEAGNAENTFALNTSAGYIYAASSSSNYLRTETALSDNSSWTISIAEGVATLTAQGTNTRNILQFNEQSGLFSCYANAQQAVALYKKAVDADVVTAPAITGETPFKDKTTVTIEAADDVKIYYTSDGTDPTTGSTEYTVPFELTTTTTVKAIAHNSTTGKTSEIATKTFSKMEVLDCATAAGKCETTASAEKYVIVGYVTEIVTAYSTQYKNISFWMADAENGGQVLQAYRAKPVTEADTEVQVGDKVEVVGNLIKYGNTPEVNAGCTYTILESTIEPSISGFETFETSTTVTITAKTGYTVYYTLDGTEPTTASTAYSAPFELTATTTVKAIASNGSKTSAVVEKIFTCTTIPTKTIAEFIAAKGTLCYLEGIVSNLTNTKYGNFDLTDESGTIYVYGCLKADGTSAQFESLGVKAGDKLKVLAETYTIYNGKEQAKNVRYVSHVSAVAIEIADMTMQIGETETIAATVTPAEAANNVTYTIKEGDCISISGNSITANAIGTATVTASVPAIGNFLANSIEFTVTVKSVATTKNVVILAQYNGQWYAMKAEKGSGSNSLAALPVEYINGKLYNVEETDKASITWELALYDGTNATFKNGANYLTGVSDKTNLTLATDACEWAYNNVTYMIGNRTFLYMKSGYFKNYATSNAGGSDYSSLPEVVEPVYATAEIYTREVTNDQWGTICLPYASSNYAGAEFYEVSYLIAEGLYLNQLPAGAQLEAGKPYIFQATTGKIAVAYEGTAVDAPVAGDGGLTGTFDGIAAGGLTGNYIIAENKVWEAGSGATLAANRAYINATAVPKKVQPEIPGRRRVCMGENEATGFDQIVAPEGQTFKAIVNGQLVIIRNGVKYNVQGQKL